MWLKNSLWYLACSIGSLGFWSSLELPAFAATIAWTDWTSGVVSNAGSASGLITLSDATPVSVTYRGEVFAIQTAGGPNYWLPSTPYLSATVSNAPPTSDIIRLIGGNSVNTLTFSQPVVNPVMAIVSLGARSAMSPDIPVRYEFDAPFNVLSSARGYWGNGDLLALPGNVLEGREGHGTIQFRGTYSAIRWVAPLQENWHGFTVGTAAAVPEPMTTAGLVLASIGLAAIRQQRHKRG